ncbi:hypothetical protein TIFTF001_003642 [Ficus carica]|uniref:Uncharacterized protein n=1 Tax=Ficus carica TaxID=3494 RepID=A0AA87ZI36_FICCA|nr:hypothetical protein TIFTF001_003642 [Ficus carica]
MWQGRGGRIVATKSRFFEKRKLRGLGRFGDEDYEVIVPTVSQSWLPNYKCNLATSIADALQPLPRSRPTSKDPSLHPFLSSSSSPSTASFTEPSRCYNHAGDSDKGDYSGTVCCVEVRLLFRSGVLCGDSE